MTACLIVELCQISAGDLNRDALADGQAGSSAELAGKLDVSCCEILRKELGVVSALSGANFQNALH